MRLENFLVADDSIAVEYVGNYLDLCRDGSFLVKRNNRWLF